jgi:hypothetical protein
MRSLAALKGPLRWSQPSALRSEYELRAGDELAGTLKLRSMFGTLADAEGGDGTWTFKRVGFWRNGATIRRAGSDEDIAVFRNNTWAAGGQLDFANGGRFRATTNFWMTRFEFHTESEQLLLRFRFGGVFRRAADVEVTDAAKRLAEWPLLVHFGWYLLVMLDRDAGATAAATG